MIEVEKIQQYWDGETGYWRSQGRLPPIKRTIEAVLRMAGLNSKKLILELASGVAPGDYYPSEISARQIVSLDLSSGMLQLNETGARIQGDARRRFLPFKNKVFDMASCIFGMRYFENQEEVLLEMLRVLKPGGILFICDFDEVKNGQEVRKFEGYEIERYLADKGTRDICSFPFMAEYEKDKNIGAHIILRKKVASKSRRYLLS